MARHAFTLDAIATCSRLGHDMAWARTWGDLGWQECTRCGQSGAYGPRQLEDRVIASPGEGQRDPAGRTWREPQSGIVYSIEERDAYVRGLRAEGKTLQEIADEVGMAMQSVHRICKAAPTGAFEESEA